MTDKDKNIKNSPDTGADSKPKDKRVGWIRLKPNKLMWFDDKSGIRLSSDEPTAAVTNNMDKTVINKALKAGIIAKVSNHNSKWPKSANIKYPKFIKDAEYNIGDMTDIQKLNPSALNEFGFTKEMHKNPNWQILNQSVVKHIRRWVANINDPEIIKQMIGWEGHSQTVHATPRVSVVNMLAARQRELLGTVSLVSGAHVAETEKESLKFA